MLSHHRLPLFLELSHRRAQATDGPNRIDSLVKDVLQDIQCIDKTTTFAKFTSGGNSEILTSLTKVISAIHQPLRGERDHTESVTTPQRQQNSSSALTEVVDLTDDYMALSEIQDIDLRRKTSILSTMFKDKPLSVLYEAIMEKNGSFEDACAYLAEPIAAELNGDLERGPVEEPKQEPKEESREELKEEPV